MAKKASAPKAVTPLTLDQRREIIVNLAGQAMQGFILGAMVKSNLQPHEILVDNVTKSAYRFAVRMLETIENPPSIP